MLDIGCGSGILALAAVKLGATPVVAVDSDPVAVDSAKKNAGLNGVAGLIEIKLSSLAQLSEQRRCGNSESGFSRLNRGSPEISGAFPEISDNFRCN